MGQTGTSREGCELTIQGVNMQLCHKAVNSIN